MKKRLMGILLTLCMTLTMTPMAAYAFNPYVSFASYPTKKDYKVGEGFDATGVKAELVESDKRTDITDQITFYHTKMGEITQGTQFLTESGGMYIEIHYGGRRVQTYKITVTKPSTGPTASPSMPTTLRNDVVYRIYSERYNDWDVKWEFGISGDDGSVWFLVPSKDGKAWVMESYMDSKVRYTVTGPKLSTDVPKLLNGETFKLENGYITVTGITDLRADILLEVEKEIFRLTNIEREKVGAEPVIWNDTLASAARKHSIDMYKRNFFSHTNLDGLDPGIRISREGYSARSSSENIVHGVAIEDRGLDDDEATVENIAQ